MLVVFFYHCRTLEACEVIDLFVLLLLFAILERLMMEELRYLKSSCRAMSMNCMKFHSGQISDLLVVRQLGYV